VINTREKDKIKSDIITKMLGDLERLYKNKEISEESYNELKLKYEKELEKIDEYYDFADLGDMIREKVERSLEKSLGKIDWYARNEFVKEDILKGKFESKDVEIDFRVENGRIELKKSDKDEYTVLIRKRVKARNRKDAEEEFEDIDVTIDLEEDRLSIHATDTVDIIAALPEKNYRIRAESENGVINISDLKGEETILRTENGKLVMKSLEFEKIDGKTENGRIDIGNIKTEDLKLFTENGSLVLDEIEADQIKAETENGHISCNCDANRQELKTERGSIRVNVSKGENIVSTEMGSIKIKVSENTKAEIEARVGMGRIKCQGRTIEEGGRYKKYIMNEEGTKEARIRAETDMGAIKIM